MTSAKDLQNSTVVVLYTHTLNSESRISGPRDASKHCFVHIASPSSVSLHLRCKIIACPQIECSCIARLVSYPANMHRFTQTALLGSHCPQPSSVGLSSGLHCQIRRTFTAYRWIFVRFLNRFRIRSLTLHPSFSIFLLRLHFEYYPWTISIFSALALDVVLLTTIQSNFLHFEHR